MSSRNAFTQQYMPLATSVGERLQVDPNLLLAQWGLETGWGKSVIPGTNNLGNIKDFSGGGVAATDNMTGSRDNYLKFDTPEAFGEHYVGLINRKYPKVAGVGNDALAFAQALREGGYAEDPNYVNKIVSIATGSQPSANVQGNTAMNQSPQVSALPNARATFDPKDPNSIYQFILANQQDSPVQQLTPEQRQMLMGDREQRASMLPLAIGASLAGDKRISGFGKALYADAAGSQGAMQLGNQGWLTPDGQLIENPFSQADRQAANRDRALTLAVQAARSNQDRAPYYTPIQTGNGVMAFNTRDSSIQPLTDAQGNPIVGAQADPTLQGRIAGAKKGATVEAEATTQRQIDAPKVIAQGEETIRLVEDLLNAPGFGQAVGKSRMFGIQMIPGTEAKDFDIRLNQLKGKQFLEAFESLKGGGQITEVEGKKATDAMSRMDAAGTEEEFIKAAREFQDVIRLGVERARISAARGEFGQTPPQAPVAPPTGARSIDDLLKQYE